MEEKKLRRGSTSRSSTDQQCPVEVNVINKNCMSRVLANIRVHEYPSISEIGFFYRKTPLPTESQVQNQTALKYTTIHVRICSQNNLQFEIRMKFKRPFRISMPHELFLRPAVMYIFLSLVKSYTLDAMSVAISLR